MEEVRGINFPCFVCAAQHSEESLVAIRCWNSKPLIVGNRLGLFFPQTVFFYLMNTYLYLCVPLCVCVCVFGGCVPAGFIINSADDDKLGCWGQQCECFLSILSLFLAFLFFLSVTQTQTHIDTHIEKRITKRRSNVEKLCLHLNHKNCFKRVRWSGCHLFPQKSLSKDR